MKKYRIKNDGLTGYIVQERFLLIQWFTLTYRLPNHLGRIEKVFTEIKDAKDYIKHLIEVKAKLKKAKYIEYL
jgi:hypothetical protein